MENIVLEPLIIKDLSPPLNPTLVTDGAGLEKVKDFIERCRVQNTVIGWDKETDFKKDFFYRRDRTWQIGNLHEQYVVDLLAFTDGNSDHLFNEQGYYGIKNNTGLKCLVSTFAPALCTNQILKCGVNLGFEYEQSYWNFGMRTWHFFDCSMVERVICAGAHTLKDYDYFGMEQMIARYFNKQIDKSLQTSFNLTDPLTQDQINYAALDTRLPLALRQAQLRILKRDGLEKVAQIENDAIGTFIDMHVHGQRINTDKWKARDKKKANELDAVIKTKLDPLFIPIVGDKNEAIDEKEIEELETKWNSFNEVTEEELELSKQIRKTKELVEKQKLTLQKEELATKRKIEKEIWKTKCSELKKKRTQINKLASMCEGNALLNYASGAQVLPVLKTVKGLESLPDMDDNTLVKYKGNPYIDALREYHKLSKQVSTYGSQWTNTWVTHPCAEEGWLHPGDGRLHAKYNQLDAETGRSTSSQPNGQNIPQDKELRSCFEADPPDENIRISDCCDSETEEKFNNGNGGYICLKCRKLCTTHAEEYCIVTADMSGAELRIIAELANAKSWIDAFVRGEDVHSVGTELLYPDKWPTLTVKSVKNSAYWTLEDCKTERIEVDGKKIPPCAFYAHKPNGEYAKEKCECPGHKKLRDGNKSTNFLLAYGGMAPTLAERLGVPLKEAEDLMRLHEKTFPDVWEYLEKSGKQAKFEKQSFDMFGRRRLFPTPTWDVAKQEIIDRAKSEANSRWERCMRKSPKEFGFHENLWDKKGKLWEQALKQTKELFEKANGRKPKKDELYDFTHNMNPISRDISFMLKNLHDRIERQGKNHAIQGSNASILKLSFGCGFSPSGMPYLWHTLPLLNAKVLSMIHDEIVVQCPKRNGQRVAKLIGRAFSVAAAERMKSVRMEFSFEISSHWKK